MKLTVLQYCFILRDKKTTRMFMINMVIVHIHLMHANALICLPKKKGCILIF